jgi:hypothetical protein
VGIVANLRAAAPLIPDGFDGTTRDDAFATSDFVASFDVEDAAGGRRTITVFFTRTAERRRTTHAAADDGGALTVLSERRLAFSPRGRLRGARHLVLALAVANAPAQAVAFDLGRITTSADPSGLTAVADDGCAGFRPSRARESPAG